MRTDAPRVLVLGAGGFIGMHLVSALLREGLSVVAATRRPMPPRADVVNVANPYLEPSVFARVLHRCVAVIHAAAHSTPGSSMAAPQLDGDLRTTLALLEALQERPQCRLLFLSSGGTLYGDRSEPARECDPLRPRSYHGAGKAAAEHFIQAWATQHRGTAVILRPSNVYGEGQSPRHGFAIVPTAMRCAREGKSLEVYGDGSQVRDYLHIEDLARLCLFALRKPASAGTHIFNAASGTPTPLNALLAMIESTSGHSIPRTHMRERPADVHTIQFDITAARDEFGWSPTVDLAGGIRSTWEWFSTQS